MRNVSKRVLFRALPNGSKLGLHEPTLPRLAHLARSDLLPADVLPAGGPQSQRTGVTLAEVIWTLALFLMCAALLTPSLQSAREAARRVACRNNLRRIGLGMESYYTFHLRFPAGVLLSSDNQTPSGTAWCLMRPHLLPNLKAIPFDPHKPWFEQLPELQSQEWPFGACPTGPTTRILSPIANAPAPQQPAAPMLLPGRVSAGVIDYALSSGLLHPMATATTPHQKMNRGFFGPNVFIDRFDVYDGISNTVALGEAVGGDTWPIGDGAGSAFLRNGRPVPALTPWLAMFSEHDLQTAETRLSGPFAGGTSAINARPVAHTTGYGDFPPPQSTNPIPLSVSGFRSNHAGGAYFLLGDGSVRFIREVVSTQVFRDLLTIDGNNRGRSQSAPPR